MEDYRNRRKNSQPIQPSAGCTFRNPAEIPAGKLIEELGLKGYSIGGAQISTKHGNFIINTGNAKAQRTADEHDKAHGTAQRMGKGGVILLLGQPGKPGQHDGAKGGDDAFGQVDDALTAKGQKDVWAQLEK